MTRTLPIGVVQPRRHVLALAPTHAPVVRAAQAPAYE